MSGDRVYASPLDWRVHATIDAAATTALWLPGRPAKVHEYDLTEGVQRRVATWTVVERPDGTPLATRIEGR
jgi:hypothetical protein